MANNDEYLRLRRLTGETQDKENYSDADLDLFINEAGGDLNAAAAAIWREKAGMHADLVDTSEAGSSRKNSDLFKNATAQAQYFEGLAGGTTVAVGESSTTRRIVRG